MSHSFDWRCDACERPNQYDFEPGATGAELVCANCSHQQLVAGGGFDESGTLRDPLEVCLACGSDKLYSQKDFNRKLGLAIVIVGAVLSPWTYGLSLVACMVTIVLVMIAISNTNLSLIIGLIVLVLLIFLGIKIAFLNPIIDRFLIFTKLDN